jgi:ClpP class serine protease
VIAVLPVYGVLTQRGNVEQRERPGRHLRRRPHAGLQERGADPAVGAIVLDVDSPGGSVYGIGELADAIYGARGSKPIVAVVNSQMASAAYWVGSAPTRSSSRRAARRARSASSPSTATRPRPTRPPA